MYQIQTVHSVRSLAPEKKLTEETVFCRFWTLELSTCLARRGSELKRLCFNKFYFLKNLVNFPLLVHCAARLGKYSIRSLAPEKKLTEETVFCRFWTLELSTCLARRGSELKRLCFNKFYFLKNLVNFPLLVHCAARLGKYSIRSLAPEKKLTEETVFCRFNLTKMMLIMTSAMMRMQFLNWS